MMRFDKFTIKSQELIQNSQALATRLKHQQIEPEHLLSAMLGEPEGIAVAMLRKLGVSPDEIARETAAAVDKLSRVSGDGMEEAYLSSRTRAVLEAAFAEATNMKDEYVSIEHIFVAIAEEKQVDFKNTLVIMTSNIGSQWIQELAAGDRREMEQRVTETLRSHFKPEFLNRIDETIIFQNLTRQQLVEIVEIQVKKLQARLAARKIELVLSDTALALIAEKGYDPIYGARPLKRVIQQNIENPLSMEILKGNISDGTRVNAEVEGKQIIFTVV